MIQSCGNIINVANITQDKKEDVNIVACFVTQETNPDNELSLKESSVVTATTATVKQATISNSSKKASRRGRAI